ncbi:MAG: YkgJ family cysteine cluster protein [Desulfobacter sp.]|nr:YkgJ family cysteine cluster protein [Desulfobacter sp.]
MESKQLTAHDIFECQLCGRCCKGFGGTYVTPQDILNIAAYIKADPSTFVDTYCDMSGSRPVLTLAENGFCIFFDPEKQCTVHPVKPYMCKAWPYIKTIIDYPENWDIMANSCPSMKKKIAHKELSRIVAAEKEKLDKACNIKP